jgi:putative ABC transport system permease protein
MLASLFTFEHGMAGELRAQTAAELVVVPRAAPGLTSQALGALAGVAEVTPVVTTHVYLNGSERFTARAVPATAFDSALRYRLDSGSLADLRGDAVAVSAAVAGSHGWRIGDTVPMRLDDGTEARLRLVAVFGGPGGYDLLPAILLPADRVAGHTAAWSVTHALITLRPNANRDAVTAAAAANLAEAVPRDRWLERTIAGYFEGNRVVLVAILGMAIAYTAIAIVNTLVMAARERVPDLAQLRLVGGTRRQAMRMLLWEGGYVAAVGVALGLAVTATSLAANTVAVRTVIPAAQPAAPWWVIALVATGAVALVLLASLATGAAALRRRPLDGLSVPE